MCPSYRVTGEEMHSTRGRARLLFEMASGELLPDGWRSTEVRDALDLCLSCKGCKRDCPVGVDMATYKAEFLAQHYAGATASGRARTGRWAPCPAGCAWSAGCPAAALANALAPPARRSRRLAKRVGGIAPQRDIPPTRAPPAAPAARRSAHPARPDARGEPRLLLWPDTFTDGVRPRPRPRRDRRARAPRLPRRAAADTACAAA